jgi:hypothetical protein
VAEVYKQGWQIELFFSVKAKSSPEDLHRGFSQRLEDANLGSVDRHVADQVPAIEGHLGMVACESGGPATTVVVRLPRFIDVDRSSLSGAGVARSMPERLAMVWQ